MALDTEKNSYTVVFAIVMVMVVGSILAGMASGLKPMVKANERYEKQQNILYAIGVNNNEGASDVVFVPTDIVEAKFQEYIKKQYVIQGGEVTEDDEAYLIDIKKEATKAKNGSYERRLPLFVAEMDGKEVYVVPVRGKGLWDAIWGFVSMDKNMVVQGVYFDHKGETPGLGANIKERFFMDDFAGEQLLDENNVFQGIKVAKGNNDPKNERKSDHQVDAIAGSTITGDGVTAMLKKDIQMYKSYFETLNQL
jgi:Na+-transporting NADH:ubiquinone oxidoreductase subunit C